MNNTTVQYDANGGWIIKTHTNTYEERISLAQLQAQLSQAQAETAASKQNELDIQAQIDGFNAAKTLLEAAQSTEAAPADITPATDTAAQ